MKRVNSFIPMDVDDRTDKEQERSAKRGGDDLQFDVSNKQKVDEQLETEKVDDLKVEEMKNHMEIVRDDNTLIRVIWKLMRYFYNDQDVLGLLHREELTNPQKVSLITRLSRYMSRKNEYERVLWGRLNRDVGPESYYDSDVWVKLTRDHGVVMEIV
ncbi:hypothetical protein Tco_1003786 [Tanacetum coccineum]|uniref:Uncharacterized protein n=1 Tax=Tanacetum coccineum TaxID=301880 RepID=A0ABQ5FA29_9ASTR